MTNLGSVYRKLGGYQLAIDCHQQALTLSQEIEDRRSEGQILGNLEQAILYHKKDLTISREVGDQFAEATASWNLGLAFEKLGDLNRAIDTLQKSFEYKRHIGHPVAKDHAVILDDLRSRLE